MSDAAVFGTAFTELFSYALQQFERAFLARQAGDMDAANNYQMRMIAALFLLAATIADAGIPRAALEQLDGWDEVSAIIEKLTAGSSSSRPSEVRELDTSVESPTESSVMNEMTRAEAEDSPVPEKAL